MALGGGTFKVQNKVLPGVYHNFVSAASASASLSDRGIATMPLDLDWGVDDEVFEVTAEEFQKNSLQIFGYAYDSDNLKGLRDLFRGAKKAFFYRLNGGGTKASNDFATAKYSGTRGNDIRIVISENVDNPSMFDVETNLLTTFADGTSSETELDVQTVATAAELVDNDFVTFNAEATLAVTDATPLAGGANKSYSDATVYQTYLDLMDAHRFNTMGVVTTDDKIKALFASYTKRKRDEQGIKFQVVLYKYTPDYMGVIDVDNKVTDTGCSEASAVYWVTGAEAGCAVNASLEATQYNGEFTIDTNYTQDQLIAGIQAGKFLFHLNDEVVEVLEDINSKTTVSDTEGEVFKDNQTIRVIDELANDDATIFNTKYRGRIQNDASGRVSLWGDLVRIREQLQTIRAIEEFTDTDVTVAQGNDKKSVVVTDEVQVVSTMSKLYMTTTIA